MNPSGERLLGLSGSESGGSLRAVLGSGARALAAVIDESLAHAASDCAENGCARPPDVSGAGASHLGVSVSLMFDGSGALQGVICLFADLTTVVDLEE